MNWIVDNDTPTFDGGEFCRYTIETRPRRERNVALRSLVARISGYELEFL